MKAENCEAIQHDIEYIRKDVILEWAKIKKAEYDAERDDAVRWGQANAFQQLIDKLNRIHELWRKL